MTEHDFEVYQAPDTDDASPVEGERPMRWLVVALDICLAVSSGAMLGLMVAMYAYGVAPGRVPPWCFRLGQIAGYFFYLGCFLFLVFVYRAHRNARALGVRKLRVSSQRAVVWFLVPILNVYLGYVVMRELWKYSDKPHQVSKLVLAWWLACLVDWGVISFTVFVVAAHEPPLELLTAVVRGVSAPVFVAAALLTSRVVHGIQGRQAARAARLAAGEVWANR